MDESKDNPKASKRSRRKAAMEPLGWEEIISQPGMGGYLSFLNGPVPLPHLQPAAPGGATDPGVVSVPEADPIPVLETTAGAASTPKEAAPPNRDRDRVVASATGVVSMSAAELAPAFEGIPGATPETVSLSRDRKGAVTQADGIVVTPGVLSTLVAPAVTVSIRQRRIRKCAAAQDGHSLGEEILYQALWKVSAPESADTRTIVIGWRGMSQLCRMTPKNCKINTQRLIRKLALKVLSPYNTPESIGTTYRIYSEAAIVQRRREAGLEWVVRSRGVEFVNPATGSILPMCAVT